ncbi:ATP-binding cassette domain-containing protein [Kurthia massiliensis]|uniref:ATP-binding cassette domain-containing protein n=1 Tax=Kurthia massiliensis TaxID=1033739 RepID=UPI000288411C|nr:ABC transporter ATP-binding protein [Kurthia massiliensis]
MIHCQRVSYKVMTTAILTDITFSIEEPKIVGLVGRNGVGKSTLMRLLAGFIQPNKGEVHVLGHHAFDDAHVAANTIYMHPQTTFPTHLTLAEICQLGAQYYNAWEQTHVDKLLRYFQLPMMQSFHELSTGVQAIFKVIFALGTRASITLLDEPMNGVDEGLRDDLYRVILKDYLAYPRLFILSSHLLDEMAHLLEDIIVLHDGKLLTYANISEFSESYVVWTGDLSKMLAHYPDAKVLPDTPFGKSQVLVPGGVEGPFEKRYVTAKALYLYLTSQQKECIDDLYTNDEQV